MNLPAFFDTYRRLFGPLRQEQVAPLEWLVLRLADYPGDCRNARRIINGLDKADPVASHARKFERCLEAANV